MKSELENLKPMKNEIETNINAAPVSTAPKATRRARYAILAATLVALSAGLAAGVIPRLRAQTKREIAARDTEQPTVSVSSAVRSQTGAQLVLPGDVHAFEQTKIHARADGYLLKWNVDIGAKVQQGQVLAEIDTPELDQELNQARAARAQAAANLALARSSAERWENLLKQRAVSEQEADERKSAWVARAADVQAADAAVARFEKLASFKEVRAPFSGTITRRLVDVGALIHAGPNATALFELAQTGTLRIHVNVPQAYLRDIATGLPVRIRVAEYPERGFTGTVVRTSGAFDAATRTLLTEIEASNQDGSLFPGIHVDVQFSLAQARAPIIVPGTSVITRADGLQVAIVDEASAIRLQKVEVGRDLGRAIEIVGGLTEGARVVNNPSDTLAEGVIVKVVDPKAAPAQKPQLAKR